MVELAASLPFGEALQHRIGSATTLLVEPLPQRSIMSLRAWSPDLDALPALTAGTGLMLPVAMNVAIGEAPRCVRIAPDEWLIMEDVQPSSVPARLAAVLGDTPHIVADIGASLAGIGVEGPLAQELLMGGCPLDLGSLRADACTRTLLGKIGMLIDRRSATRFELHVDVSVARHAAKWLRQAALPLIGQPLAR